MKWFCTHFDVGYLPQGLALYQSLQRHVPGSTLIILCLDEEVERRLRALQLDRMRLVPLAQLEQSDERLPALRAERRRSAYYFTLKSCLCRHVLHTMPDVDFLTYMDSDVCFFSPVDSLFQEIGNSDAAVCLHRFPPQSRWREAYGLFNAGWVSFRRSPGGEACLQWWHERCLEWCHDYVDASRFADQKYLEVMAATFPNVCAVSHPGANLGPWNLQEDQLAWDGRQVLVDGKPLIFFHFSGVERLSASLFDSGLGEYRLVPGPVSREHIFKPYFRALMAGASIAESAPPSDNRKTGYGAPSALVFVDSEAPSENVPALEQLICRVEERANWAVASRDAHVRALDAGGLWLREVIRQAEVQRKSDLARIAQLEKQLKAQTQQTAQLRQNPLKAIWRSIVSGLSKQDGNGDPDKAAVNDTKSPWPPAPEAIISRWSKSHADLAEHLGRLGPNSPQPGESCLFVHASPRTVAVAAVLSATGCRCVVMGCPGWLKSYSTEALAFSMEGFSAKLRADPAFPGAFDVLLLDEADHARLARMLEGKLPARLKLLLLDRSREISDGLDFCAYLRLATPPTSPEDRNEA